MEHQAYTSKGRKSSHLSIFLYSDRFTAVFVFFFAFDNAEGKDSGLADVRCPVLSRGLSHQHNHKLPHHLRPPHGPSPQQHINLPTPPP